MKSGKMNKRVTLQRKTSTRSETGQVLPTVTELGKSFCSINPLSGREYIVSDGAHSDVTHKISMRARSDLSLRPDDQILYGTRTFDIQSVLDEEEDGRQWMIMVKELISTHG